MTMQATLTFLRQYPLGAPPLQFVSTSPIPAQTATLLAESLQGSQSSHPPTIFIPALFPRLLELPVSGSIGTSESIGETIAALISGTSF